MSISVVIHTLNAEKYLDECLRSVAGADEIIVCDMHSTDRTVPIAEAHGCRIIHHEPAGYADPARNFAIGHAKSDWILVLDADEIVPGELWEYLERHASGPDPGEALRIPRRNFALGRPLWCWYPTRLVRFFRRGCVDWPARVHGVPRVAGRIKSISHRRLDLALIHYNYDSIEDYISRLNKYTTLEVEKFRQRGEKFTLTKMIWRSFYEFCKLLIYRRGYRDGMHGLVFTVLTMFYQFVAMAKLWEAELRDRRRAAAMEPAAPLPAAPPAAMPTPVPAAAAISPKPRAAVLG
ncbi:MAG: glycosyltransferase family 2 protein [Phycisphaeraceae bacterium]|nr:glycosyltransferase family 2 protein [Phycisphaeraceae bacterium]